MDKTNMIKSLKIKLIAIYMLLLGVSALIYISLPLFIVYAVYKAFEGEWMIAVLATFISAFAYGTSDWYHDFFMDQHYAFKEKIEKLKK